MKKKEVVDTLINWGLKETITKHSATTFYDNKVIFANISGVRTWFTRIDVWEKTLAFLLDGETVCEISMEEIKFMDFEKPRRGRAMMTIGYKLKPPAPIVLYEGDLVVYLNKYFKM